MVTMGDDDGNCDSEAMAAAAVTSTAAIDPDKRRTDRAAISLTGATLPRWTGGVRRGEVRENDRSANRCGICTAKFSAKDTEYRWPWNDSKSLLSRP